MIIDRNYTINIDKYYWLKNIYEKSNHIDILLNTIFNGKIDNELYASKIHFYFSEQTNVKKKILFG